jgi:thioredoxin 1
LTISRLVNKNSFTDEVLKCSQPVLVDFGAAWCSPCKKMEPLLEQLAAELQGRVQLLKVDVQDDPDLAGRYQVMSLPTVILFVSGEPVQKLIGLQTRQKLEEKLTPWITSR